MGLLDKLAQVEIKADSRLPEDDLMFCETQQGLSPHNAVYHKLGFGLHYRAVRRL